eukprot:996025-Alexandrium_andersonii.AAC.1
MAGAHPPGGLPPGLALAPARPPGRSPPGCPGPPAARHGGGPLHRGQGHCCVLAGEPHCLPVPDGGRNARGRQKVEAHGAHGPGGRGPRGGAAPRPPRCGLWAQAATQVLARPPPLPLHDGQGQVLPVLPWQDA